MSKSTRFIARINYFESIVLLCIFILSAFYSITFSQTYICPVVGYDFQKVTSDPINFLDLKQNGFGFVSPLLGLKLKQKIYKPFYFQFNWDVTHKHVRGYVIGSLTQDLLYHYNYYKYQFLLNYHWKDKLYIGAGKSFNIVNKFHYEDFENSLSRGGPIENFNEQGWVFVIGFKYKKIDFEAYYFKREDNIDEFEFHYSLMYHVQSIGLRVSYDFKLFNGFKKKEKLDCPEFK
ncbi:MAG: hypothetical protein IPK91_07495 [Saprospiraceae bacterium]|nr:hypothetical protein [Saprospiraceae bacterium]MBK8297109.1 hypothetical protein [Saprospiraceae bacterium]